MELAQFSRIYLAIFTFYVFYMENISALEQSNVLSDDEIGEKNSGVQTERLFTPVNSYYGDRSVDYWRPRDRFKPVVIPVYDNRVFDKDDRRFYGGRKKMLISGEDLKSGDESDWFVDTGRRQKKQSFVEGGVKLFRHHMGTLLLAYKLKFFTLIPLMIAGMLLIVGSTGLAGFFFALFAASMGIRGIHNTN